MWQIAYRTVEVSPLTKKQIRWADYKKVPVVVMDGDAYGDSTAIITRLAGELEAEQQGVSKAMQSRMSRGIWPFSSSKSSGDVQVSHFMELLLSGACRLSVRPTAVLVLMLLCRSACCRQACMR